MRKERTGINIFHITHTFISMRQLLPKKITVSALLDLNGLEP